jgi:urea transporter
MNVDMVYFFSHKLYLLLFYIAIYIVVAQGHTYAAAVGLVVAYFHAVYLQKTIRAN